MGRARAKATRASSCSLRCTRQNPPQSSNGSESSSAVSRSDKDELCLLCSGGKVHDCVLQRPVLVFRGTSEGAYYRRQRCVQTGLRSAVLCIAVFITAAAVVDKTHLQVHPSLQPEREKETTKKILPSEWNLLYRQKGEFTYTVYWFCLHTEAKDVTACRTLSLYTVCIPIVKMILYYNAQ